MTEEQKKYGTIALLVLSGGVLAVMLWRTFASEEYPADFRTIMDSETGELFKVRTEELKPYPMRNPKTGTDTLYRTEVCFYGEECRKSGGTRVIMNTYLHKEEPTYCPVCGHVVRFHNPLPSDYTPPR